MKLKEIFKDIFRTSINIAKFCFLWAIIVLLVLVILHGINFLLPVIINILKLSAAPISVTEPQSIFETSSKVMNFAIVYITILFTLMGIIVAIMSVWGSRSLHRLEKSRQDYEEFRKNSPLEARLTTAKIFFIQKKHLEAWEQIKDLPDDFHYAVPLYKARILIGKRHEDSVFFPVMKFLNKALSFPGLTNEAKSIIYRYISRAYFKEKKDYKKALEYAEMAINENPTYWSAHNTKALALRHLDRLREAIGTLKEIIKEDKNFEAGYYNLACYYSLKSEKETDFKKQRDFKNKAIEYYKEAIRIEPENRILAKTDPDLDFIRDEIKDLQIT